MNEARRDRLGPRLSDTLALWPSPEYERQVEKLRGGIGQRIYLVEARLDELHLSAQFSGTDYGLLDVLDFPRPDPVRRLYPHMVLLDDGRGINLGRILRISLGEPYAPAPEKRLFEDRSLTKRLLDDQRRLNTERIRLIARRQLGDIVQEPPSRRLAKARSGLRDNSSALRSGVRDRGNRE